MSDTRRIASALARVPNNYGPGSPAPMDSLGLETPPEVNALIASLLMPPVAGAIRGAAASAPARLASDAGAIFPETSAPELLPAIAKGAKTGDPHALFAYNDNFGPEFSKRAIYNIYGDPAHPALQAAGWGSSLPVEALKKFGIPIVGKQG